MSMEGRRDAYMVLPSNSRSSARGNFENKTSHYRIYLPRALELANYRKYECALAEITFPQTFQTAVHKRDCNYSFSKKPYTEKLMNYFIEKISNTTDSDERDEWYTAGRVYISSTIGEEMAINRSGEDSEDEDEKSTFRNLESLVEWLNESKPMGMDGNFGISLGNGLVYIRVKKKAIVELGDTLADALGFEKTKLRGKQGKRDDDTGDDEDEPKRKKYKPSPLSNYDESYLASTLKGKKYIDFRHLAEAYRNFTPSISTNGEDNQWEDAYTEKIQRKANKYHNRIRARRNPPQTEDGEKTNKKKDDDDDDDDSYYIIQASKRGDVRITNYNMFVYSNLIRESLVGDKEVKLLRTIPIKEQFNGQNVSISFPKLRYHPLSSGYFEYIEIYLSDDVGEILKFKSGKVITVLHLRKQKKN